MEPAASGILRSSGEIPCQKPKKQRSRIVWDEENITETEQTRTATMKIDEPKTPFNEFFMGDMEHHGSGM
jgi:hypothetical protein